MRLHSTALVRILCKVKARYNRYASTWVFSPARQLIRWVSSISTRIRIADHAPRINCNYMLYEDTDLFHFIFYTMRISSYSLLASFCALPNQLYCTLLEINIWKMLLVKSSEKIIRRNFFRCFIIVYDFASILHRKCFMQVLHFWRSTVSL